MTAYVLLYVTYENNKNHLQPIQITSINVHSIDSNLDNITNELLIQSSRWITDEIGRNNYIETIDETKGLSDLPDGLIRRYANPSVDPKELFFSLNKPIKSSIKQINIFRKQSTNGKLFGRWVDLELIRSYAIFQGSCNGFHQAISTNSPSRCEKIIQNTPLFDNVINELKKFSISGLRKASLRDTPVKESSSSECEEPLSDVPSSSEESSSECEEPLSDVPSSSEESSSEESSSEESSSDESSSEEYSSEDCDVSSDEIEVIVAQKYGDFELLDAIIEAPPNPLPPSTVPPPPPMPPLGNWKHAAVFKTKFD